MAAESDFLSSLRQRIRVRPSLSSVPGSLPVLCFGDAVLARVATIGLNPSKFEYVDRNGALLAGAKQRFATTNSLGVATRDDLSDSQADIAIDMMRSYYDDGKPVYGSYFRHPKNFLQGVGANYASRSAVHLDLVQEATDPVWRGLDAVERSSLLERDMPFLVWQLESLPRLEAVVCAGKTVSEQVCRHIRVDVRETGQMKRLRWWLGTAHTGHRELPIGGWNHPLDRPTGLGTIGEIGLGEEFARGLLKPAPIPR